MKEHKNEKREKPSLRKHKTYMESDHWTVVDMSGVDKLTVADLVEGNIRIDLDAFIEPSSDVGKRDDNINISVWLLEGKARELLKQLKQKLKDNEGAKK